MMLRTGGCVQRKWDTMQNEECRATALRIAKDYERLARHAERHAGRNGLQNVNGTA
jgi:hypothetical protein